MTDLSYKATQGRFPDLQKVFTNRGRWCCPEGRLTVHEEVRLCACLHFERRLHLHLEGGGEGGDVAKGGGVLLISCGNQETSDFDQ